MKKIYICILGIISSLFIALSVACSSVKLVGFESKTYEAEYGSVFRIEALSVQDEEGKEYTPAITVTDSNGKVVEVTHKQFTVLDKNGYSVKYDVDVDGKVQSKTDTIKVVPSSAPVVDIDGKISAIILGQTYEVPTVSALDYYDGELTPATEIYKVAEGGDVKCNYDGKGEFTPTETGTYYVKATATNSADMATSETLTFYTRAQAVDGEWDTFDDAGCLYTSVENSMIGGKEWLQSFKGREGVMAVKFNENDAYSASLRIFPKSNDKERIENYTHFVVSVYVEGKEGSFFNYNFCSPNAVSLPMQNIKYNAWNTFVFNATGVLNNWESTFISSADSSNAYMIGSALEDCTLYFDSVYFANAAALTGEATETENVVTLNYAAGENDLAYTVLYDGKPIEVKGNTFKADFAGEYLVYPQIINSVNEVYTGEAIAYQSNGKNVLAISDYDETVALGATNYALPTASVVDSEGAPVAGYEITTEVVYSDWLGNSEAKEFEPLKKGYYDFTFTASKDGEKSLYKTVRVRVGEYLDGEVFNVSDMDAPNRVSTMGMSGTIATVDGREIGRAKSENYLKLPYNLSSPYLMTTAYVNFAPSATTEDVNDWKYDRVNVAFYLKATLIEGVTEMPKVTLTFLGVKVELTPNAYNEISVASAAFVNRYYRLSETATWADSAFSVNVATSRFKTTFSELALYMSDVTADCSEMPTNLVIVEEDQTVLYNADLTPEFMTAAEWKAAGIVGDYTGNAIAYSADSNNGGFRANFNLSRRQMTEFTNKYDFVTMWVAVDNGTSDQWVLLTEGLVAQSQEANAKGQCLFSKGADNFKKWVKLTITAEDYVNFAMGQSSLHLFKISAGDQAMRTYYIGDITYGRIPTAEDYDNLGADRVWQ